MDPVVPDYKKSLSDLRAEWEGCTRCELGRRRNEVGGHFVFGEGRPRGILFIGEGPGKEEEARGAPFIGPSGNLLRTVLKKLGLTHVYITNTVTCRSCHLAYDTEGKVMMRKDFKTGHLMPVIQDDAPLPSQVEACMPRLVQEIYLVDPILVVALGQKAAESLLGRPVSILSESGETMTMTIPGGSFRPSLTEKKQAWARKVKGQFVLPTVQSEVEYLLMPLIHPAYVLRKIADQRDGNPLQKFVEGMKRVAWIFDRYMFEVYGDHPEAREIDETWVMNVLEEEKENGQG